MKLKESEAHILQSADSETFQLKSLQLKSLKKQRMNTFINAAAALRLMTATDSRLRRRGNRFRAERELEKEQSEAVPGVMGVCGTLKPSTSSTMRKARPRDRGSTICTHAHTVYMCCFTTCLYTHVYISKHRATE